MSNIQSTIVPPPQALIKDVACFCIFEHSGDREQSIHVSPTAAPGIVFQQFGGHAAISSIEINSTHRTQIPTLFFSKAGIHPSTMNFRSGNYSIIYTILKPHAIKTLLGINAAAMTDECTELNDFSRDPLEDQLLNLRDSRKQIDLLSNFLCAQLRQAKPRDTLIEESLWLIEANIHSINVKSLRERLAISERQLQRRFSQIVGVTPQSYIRVRRFNEAIRLLKTGQYKKLTNIAYALNFYDQSHFIRDVQAFCGINPKEVLEQIDDVYHDQLGYSYL